MTVERKEIRTGDRKDGRTEECGKEAGISCTEANCTFVIEHNLPCILYL